MFHDTIYRTPIHYPYTAYANRKAIQAELDNMGDTATNPARAGCIMYHRVEEIDGLCIYAVGNPDNVTRGSAAFVVLSYTPSIHTPNDLIYYDIATSNGMIDAEFNSLDDARRSIKRGITRKSIFA